MVNQDNVPQLGLIGTPGCHSPADCCSCLTLPHLFFRPIPRFRPRLLLSYSARLCADDLILLQDFGFIGTDRTEFLQGFVSSSLQVLFNSANEECFWHPCALHLGPASEY